MENKQQSINKVSNTLIYNLKVFYKSRFEEQVDFSQAVEIFCVPKLFGRRLDQQLLKFNATTLLRLLGSVWHQRNMAIHGKKNCERIGIL